MRVSRRLPPVAVVLRDLRDEPGLVGRRRLHALVPAHMLDIAVALVLRDLHARLGADPLDEVADERRGDDHRGDERRDAACDPDVLEDPPSPASAAAARP